VVTAALVAGVVLLSCGGDPRPAGGGLRPSGDVAAIPSDSFARLVLAHAFLAEHSERLDRGPAPTSDAPSRGGDVPRAPGGGALCRGNALGVLDNSRTQGQNDQSVQGILSVLP